MDEILALDIKRLTPVNDEDWKLFYQLLERIRQACREGLSNIDEDKLTAWLKLRFVNDGNLYLIIAMQDNKIIGHLIGWIETEFDKTLFFIHQAKCDINLGKNIINVWRIIKKMLPPNIDSIRFWTKRKGFERYLKKIGLSVNNKYNLLEVI